MTSPQQQPDVKITLGDDEFFLGENLIEVDWSFGESTKRSVINFTLYDFEGKIAHKYLENSFKKSGLTALPKEEETATTTGGSTSLGNESVDNSNNGTVSRGGKFTAEVCAFLDTVASKETATPLARASYFSNNGVGSSQGSFPESESIGSFPISAGKDYNVGRYQFRKGDWQDAKNTDKTITGYTPVDQDKVAYYKLQYRGALAPLLKGDIVGAIDKSAHEWASLPTKDNPRGLYNQVQEGTNMQGLVSYYNTRLAYYKGLVVTPESTPMQQKEGSPPLLNQYQTLSIFNSTTAVSYYGLKDGTTGKLTASGEVFNPDADFTCAHNSLGFGTLLKVTWVTNNKSVIVRVNDRRGFAKLDRQLDLSTVAMKALSDSSHDAIAAGIISARIEVVQKTTNGSENLAEKAKKNALDSVEKARNQLPPTQVTEQNFKGQQITLEFSLDGGSSYACSSYIHQGTVYRGLDKHIVSFSGVAVSWKLNRVLKSTRYSNCTLKGLAKKIANNYKMDLLMNEEGDFIENVAQVSMTDWKFLTQICERQGFIMRTIGRQLTINRIDERSRDTYTIDNKAIPRVLSLTINDTAQTAADATKYQQGTVTTTIAPDSGTTLQSNEKNNNAVGVNKQVSTGHQLPPGVIGKNYSNPRTNQKAVREFTAKVNLYAIREDLENLTPDTPLTFNGVDSFLDSRVWFIESVGYSFSSGVTICSLDIYQLLSTNLPADSGTLSNAGIPQSVIPDKGVGSIGGYKINNPDGSAVNAFNNLKPHWGAEYIQYIPDSSMDAGKISTSNVDKNRLIYDFTLSKDGDRNCLVPSPVSGMVTTIGGGEGQVVIKGINGGIYKLLHMKGIVVQPGQTVLRGTILGTQGAVGRRVTGTHLHFQGDRSTLENYITSLLSGNFL